MTFLQTESQGEGMILPHDGDAKPEDNKLTRELQDEDEGEDESIPDNIVAFQTGPDAGPSYAGGMEYDRSSNSVYVTGATYGTFTSDPGPGDKGLKQSSCFFGIVSLPELEWKERETYGTEGVAEACSSLSLTSYGGNKAAIVVGSTEENGLLTNLGAGKTAAQYGFAMDLAKNSDSKFSLLGGALMDGTKVQYPLAVHAEDEQVWTASMSSTDTKVTANYEKVSNNRYPNLTTGGIEKYGSHYEIVVEKHKMARSLPDSGEEGRDLAEGDQRETLALEYRKPFEIGGKESIFVSGMVRLGKELVVVGSTHGGSGGKSLNGIMAKLNADDGSFFFEDSSTIGYLDSKDGRDDWIMNICPDPDDSAHFYIVGATKGNHDPAVSKDSEDLTVHALMAKINLSTLEPAWKKQYTVKHASGSTDKEAAAAALGCDVIPNQKMMYVAGVVENFATIQYEGAEEEQESAGGDDLFVSLVSTVDGKTMWLKQVGSNGNDRLARGGGVKVDANENAVVFGDTTGSFYRSRSQDASPRDSDLFMMVFDFRDGMHLPPLKGPPAKGTFRGTPGEWYPPHSINVGDAQMFSSLLTFLALFALYIFCGITYRENERKKQLIQKTRIFTYLQPFDVEDIDLRKSPPGGWHGTYLNKLAYGINDGSTTVASHEDDDDDDDDDMLYSNVHRTHSSIVNDSLFMDAAPVPPAGGYADAYEEPYDDLPSRYYGEGTKGTKTGTTLSRDIL